MRTPWWCRSLLLLPFLTLVACAPEPGRSAGATAKPAVSSSSSALAERRRITGGPQPAIALTSLQRVASGLSPFVNGCDGVAANGTLYPNAEVEPSFAINPLNANIMVGAWQQDRWSNGASRGLVSGTSLDGGHTWQRTALPFSRCGGGTVLNGGDYQRASDPWVSYAPNGVVHAMSLSVSGAVSAMLVSRSFDHGLTWSNPITLIVDGAGAFNDKNALTADPNDANVVYAVWDRLIDANDTGPAYFSRSTDGGASWEASRPIYDPGTRNQTIGNIVVVLPSGVLLNMFTQIDSPIGGAQVARVAVIRSLDRGVNWSAPVYISNMLSVGTRNPETGAGVRDGSIVPSIAVAPNGDVYVAWQDSRFSGGVVDGIAISRSSDGGLTWSAPSRVNAVANVAAFTPSVHVTRDGVVGVSYYDFRSNTATAPLLTEYWLARSGNNGATWSETRVADAFDLTTAPVANGMFVGDYQGLSSAQGKFVPFYGRANSGDFANRTDIVAAPLAHLGFPPSPKTVAVMRAEMQSRQPPRGLLMSKAWRERVDANVRRQLKHPPGMSNGWTMPNVMRAL